MCNLVCTVYIWLIYWWILDRDDFLPSLLFIHHSVNYSRFYGAASKGLLKYFLLYTSYILFDWSFRPGTYSVRHPLCMRLLDASYYVLGFNDNETTL